MSNYNENNSRSGERLTVAGIAAIIVVGVFVVCLILILARSLFPSNKKKAPDGEYTGTTPAQTQKVTESQQPVIDTNSQVVIDLDGSSADSTESAPSDSSAVQPTDSAAAGETSILNQTAYLRSSGDENADPILSISAGEEVTVIERPAGSEYVKVSYYGTEGWVWNGYLS